MRNLGFLNLYPHFDKWQVLRARIVCVSYLHVVNWTQLEVWLVGDHWLISMGVIGSAGCAAIARGVTLFCARVNRFIK